jgi:DNA repair exonuclease SbcCD nuclease subunit
MVHGDPGVPDSHYAPLSLSRLQSLPVDGWLLGHIHKPSFTPGSPWVLMPGSPQPLDPGEPDAHHAWIIETQNGSLTTPIPCCPASLLYRTVKIALTPEQIPTLDFLHSQLRDAVASAGTDAFQILRIRFTGQTGSATDLEELTEALTEWENPAACVDQVRIDTLPALDLESLQDAGPVPAKLIQALDSVPPELQEMLQDTLRSLAHQKEFTLHGLTDFSLEDLPVNTLLEKTLRTALESIA